MDATFSARREGEGEGVGVGISESVLDILRGCPSLCRDAPSEWRKPLPKRQLGFRLIPYGRRYLA